MSLFGRKPDATPSPSAGPGKGSDSIQRHHRHHTIHVPHSRQHEHASEPPRGVDSNFCYGEDQDA
ncbi:MAG TPA: hypothetical protein VNN55_12535 [bacterium]|nr:hypothetical protein [bacterium]